MKRFWYVRRSTMVAAAVVAAITFAALNWAQPSVLSAQSGAAATATNAPSTATNVAGTATATATPSTSTPTPTPPPPFVFTTVGDYGANKDSAEVLKQIRAVGPDFHLALGDYSYRESKDEATWCDFANSNLGPEVPFLLVTGNHEEDGQPVNVNDFAACMPATIEGIQGTYPTEYYFDYGHLARFIVIAPDLVVDGQSYDYAPGNARFNWLSDTIDSARSADIPWVIVAMHKVCLSIGRKECGIGPDLMNLLIEKKVDLVLQAHDHNYQRTKQLTTNDSCPEVPTASFKRQCVAIGQSGDVYYHGAGTVFVVAGMGGKGLYEVDPQRNVGDYFAAWMGSNESPSKGVLKVTVSSSQIKGEFIAATSDSTFADDFVISKHAVNDRPAETTTASADRTATNDPPPRPGASSPTANAPSPPAPVIDGLSWAADQGVIEPPFTISNGVLTQAVETDDPAAGGRAAYRFNITTPGEYVVRMRVRAPDAGANSLFVNIDGEPTSPTMIWDLAISPSFEEQTVAWRGGGTFEANEFVPKTFPLSAGEHTLILRGREANVEIQQLSLVRASS